MTRPKCQFANYVMCFEIICISLKLALNLLYFFYQQSKSLFFSVLHRTRESLASNTSSIVESNRRQNPALSPGHIGTSSIGLPFSFRAIPEPPTTQPEKLQKSSNCLASITSVWQAGQTVTVEVMEYRREAVRRIRLLLSSDRTYMKTLSLTHTHTSSDSWRSI